ncbi:MAG: NADP-dependent 3-hydroxy acid dehydrogenase YdfG [Oceanospirillaceae bacterium]|jgi:NADP-dependent 3-hydroxy acid dehydrogenase YdfG
MSFKNKKIVITGTGRDFGQTLAILFAKMGAELFLSARTLENANATANLVRKTVPDAKVSTFQVNTCHPTEIAKFAQDVSIKTPEIDILINNAAYWLDGDIEETTDEDIVEAVNSTATGSMLVTKHFLPLIKKSTYPDIIFINSTASLENNTHATCNEAFSAAKAAQSTFSDRLRHRLKGSGVRFTCIYPPNFDNTSPIKEQDWDEERAHTDTRFLTARNIFGCIKFCLTQDRICSIDKIILSNNNYTAKLCE